MSVLAKENEQFVVHGWEESKEQETKENILANNWSFWMLLPNEVLNDCNEMSDEEFYGLAQKSGVFSFWEASEEELYSEGDGEELE